MQISHFDPIQPSASRLPLFRSMALLLLLVVVSLPGCGRGKLPTYAVEGQVRFSDGSTPAFGDIEFYNEENKLNARGKINKDGTFTVSTYEENDGAIAGKHKIVIIQNTGSVLAAQMNVKIHHDHGSLVHRSYVDYRTSNLSCTIAKGINQIELVVQKQEERDDD